MSDTQSPVFKLDQVWYRYRRRWALQDVSAAAAGPAVGVLGPNGAGKSTMLALLGGVRQARSGRVVVADVSMGRNRQRRQLQRTLGFVPQAADVLPSYTVSEVLRYVAWLRQLPAPQVGAAIDRSLHAVGLTSERHTRIARLSGGMRQRVLLAQALVNDPRLVILDEPTVGLDPGQRRDFLQLLAEFRHTCQLVLATHLVEDIATVCDSVVLLDRGASVFQGSLPELVARGGGSNVTGPTVESGYHAVLTHEHARDGTA